MTQDTPNPETGTRPDAATQDPQASEAPRTGADAPLAPEEHATTISDEPDLREEAARLRDQMLRALAEVDNTKKRAARDVKDAREYAVTGFARDMLDVADNLARALACVGEDARASAGPALQNLLEGVEMTERRLLATLERHGVRKVEPVPGDALDPNIHQAAAQVPADQVKGSIAHVMQPGYVIGDRTLRAAMVVVSAGPVQSAPTQEGGRPTGTGGSVDVSA